MTTSGPGGWTFVATARGCVVAVPDTWVSRPARTGMGIIYERLGASADRFSVRITDPTPRYPEGDAVFYDQYGQPTDINGRVTSRTTWHIPLDQIRPLPPPGLPPP